MRWLLGSALDLWGAYSAPPEPLGWTKGMGRGGKRGRDQGKGEGEDRGRVERGRGRVSRGKAKAKEKKGIGQDGRERKTELDFSF